jgi:hypothetical protein
VKCPCCSSSKYEILQIKGKTEENGQEEEEIDMRGKKERFSK